MSCWAPSGSPPITYRLVSKDGQVHMQKTPPHGQPANFSIPPSPMPGWFQCQAENSISVQSSTLMLVPPGKRVTQCLEGKLVLLGCEGAVPSVREATVQNRGGPQQAARSPWYLQRQPSPATSAAHRGAAPGSCTCAGRKPHLHRSYDLRDAGLDKVSSGCLVSGSRAATWAEKAQQPQLKDTY